MVERVSDIGLGLLREWNITGIALDLDNTIVPWHTSDVVPEIAQWVRQVRETGVRFCLLTNNYASNVRRVGAALDMPVVRGALKPLPSAFSAALRQLRSEASQSLSVGDQLFTDVLGAKAVGMRAIVVKPLTTRDFPTTRLLRMLEGPVYARLRRTAGSALA